MRKIFRSYGLRGLYRGAGSTMTRELLGYGVYFSSFELFMRALIPEGSSRESLSLWYTLAAGALAGEAMWLTAFPIDVVKTRI